MTPEDRQQWKMIHALTKRVESLEAGTPAVALCTDIANCAWCQYIAHGGRSAPHEHLMQAPALRPTLGPLMPGDRI